MIFDRTFFVTTVTWQRTPLFRHAQRAELLIDVMKHYREQKKYVLHDFVIMPDHLHLLVEGRHANSDFLNFMKTFKLRSTRSFAQSSGSLLWQKKFFDHILRSSGSIDSVALYIWLNPVRAGLAANLGEYPFAGSFTRPLRQAFLTQRTWVPPKTAKSPPQKAASTREA